jgi:hypothetical protein
MSVDRDGFPVNECTCDHPGPGHASVCMVNAPVGAQPEYEDENCPHLSFTGIDTYFGPGKVMRCDECGLEKTVDWGVRR